MPDTAQIEPLVRLLGPFSATVLVAAWWITQALRARGKNGNPSREFHLLEEIKSSLEDLGTKEDKSYLALLSLDTKVAAGVKRLEDVWAELQKPGG